MNSARIHEKALSNIRKISAGFADRMEWISGWEHDFVCDRCSARLRFVPDPSEYESNAFACENCGAVFSGETYQAAWVYLYRRWIASGLLGAALCKDEPEAAALVRRCLLFYAERYDKFPLHGEHAGQGRIMAQSLDEAVFGIHLLRAVDECRECFDESELQFFRDRLFFPMAELLLPQAQRIHNISVWCMCCVGMTGRVFGEEALVREAEEGPFGLRRQLNEGLTDDWLWREGSLYYHYYVLRALTAYCAVLKKKEPKHPLLLLLARMYVSPARLSCDGWIIPSLNDGWYPLTLETYGSEIVQAARLTGDETLKRQAERILAHAPEIAEEPAVALLDGPTQNGGEICFGGRVAVLREPFFMTLKSGSAVDTHAHRDLLSVTIAGLSEDLGTPGYASPLTKRWYRGPLSHNGFAIDGNLKVEFPENAVRLTDDGAEAALNGTCCGEEICASRTLCREEGLIRDRMSVKLERAHVIDWVFHAEGQFECKARQRPASLGEKGAFALFEDVRKADCKEIFEAKITDNTGCVWHLQLRVPPGMSIFIARTPSNPADRKRNTVLCRVTGPEACFEAAYSREPPVRKSGIVGRLLGRKD